MARELWMIDKRLTKLSVNADSDKVLSMRTDAGDTLSSIVQRAIKLMQPFGKITVLHIAAHGTEASGEAPDEKQSKTAGGFGIQLGEGITQGNPQDFAPLAAIMATGSKCIVYACSAADQPYGQNPDASLPADGPAILTGLAAALGVPVTASDATQIFSEYSVTPDYKNAFKALISNPADAYLGIDIALDPEPMTFFDFGPWEGAVFDFAPDGTITKHRKKRAP